MGGVCEGWQPRLAEVRAHTPGHHALRHKVRSGGRPSIARTAVVGRRTLAEGGKMLKRILLACGVLSSLLYVGIDALAALRYPEYHSYASQAISELGAVGAPTKELVDPLFIIYGVLLIAFGVG